LPTGTVTVLAAANGLPFAPSFNVTLHPVSAANAAHGTVTVTVSFVTFPAALFVFATFGAPDVTGFAYVVLTLPDATCPTSSVVTTATD